MPAKPFVVLGLTHPISWNNAAALLVDGEIAAFAEEERFIRFKHAPRVPPLRAMAYCLASRGLSLDDVDAIAIGWDEGATWMPDFNLRRNIKRYHVTRHHMRQFPFDVKDKRVHFVNHHVAHALSSFYFSGFDKANVMSLDASGGNESGILAVGDGARLETLHTVSNDSSWGVFYGLFTGVLGFRPHADEGKVMGLAAYGTPDPDRFTFIDWSREVPVIDRDAMKAFLRRIRPRADGEPLAQEHKDLAATLQACFERGVRRMARFLHDRTGLTTFAVAGGCALNCSTNGRLLDEPFVERIFVQPAAHDASTALGAAAWAHHKRTGERPRATMRHAYWGPAFDDDAIAKTLRRAKLGGAAWRAADVATETAQRLADGQIIGWFQGRMEAGPRALGGRSILADPRDIRMKDTVNNDVKGREPWRPFAPSFLAEAFAPFVERPHASPFMILAFRGKPGFIEKIPAAAHVDRTIRVQTVERAANPPYWDLISAFARRTGVPALLNTSFNVAGQPIVCTPFDALSTFFASGLDALVMGNWIVDKKAACGEKGGVRVDGGAP